MPVCLAKVQTLHPLLFVEKATRLGHTKWERLFSQYFLQGHMKALLLVALDLMDSDPKSQTCLKLLPRVTRLLPALRQYRRQVEGYMHRCFSFENLSETVSDFASQPIRQRHTLLAGVVKRSYESTGFAPLYTLAEDLELLVNVRKAAAKDFEAAGILSIDSMARPQRV